MGRTGYAPLPADVPDDNTEPVPFSPKPSSRPARASRPSPTALHVDELFQRWTRTIADRIKKKSSGARRDLIPPGPTPIDIIASVLSSDTTRSTGRSAKGKEKVHEPDQTRTLDHEEPMPREAFDGLVERVQSAIDHGVHPRLNAKGSSGSYFARDASGTTLGIFKPKDEEPYGRLNPKLVKYIHRNFLSRIIPFGRACLIPQLSYLSEAAASLIDRRLDANIVPRTEVIELSSPAFFYDFLDRERAARAAKGKRGRRAVALPQKPGSFQVFLKGFQDASDFLRRHPYPGRPLAQTFDPSPRRRKRVTLFSPLRCLCGRAEAEEDDPASDDEGWGWGGEDGAVPRGFRREGGQPFKWTEDMMTSFREELEKLVVLDYLIRNTDRGLDNFMVKACYCTSADPSPSPVLLPSMSEVRAPSPIASPSITRSSPPGKGHIHLAGIDNSLAFPHLHPLGWRTYAYGWLYLPVSCIGQPFTRKTRDHYLPLLSSSAWWAQTTMELRELFRIDPDFSEEMFRKQLSVMKGQAFNLVASLRNENEGPLELCRRPKKLVWDDPQVVADDDFTRALVAAAAAGSPPPTPTPPTPPTPPSPPPRATSPLASKRSPIVVPAMPVPLQRVSSDHTTVRKKPAHRAGLHARSLSSGVPEQEYGSLTGVSMLEHLERVEKAERSQHVDPKGKGREYQVVHSSESDEDDAGPGDEWGVKSEGDLRAGRAWQERVRERWSADLERGPARQTLDDLAHDAKDLGRNRSGSLGNIERGKLSRGQVAGRDAGTHWFGDLEQDLLNEAEEDGERAGRGRTKVVIVERLESVEEKPLLAWLLRR